MRNSFEPHQTFCPANFQSFVRQFEFSPDILLQIVRQISNFSLDICSVNIVLDLLSPDLLSGEIRCLRRTFFKICQTSPASPANFAYSDNILIYIFLCIWEKCMHSKKNIYLEGTTVISWFEPPTPMEVPPSPMVAKNISQLVNNSH